MLNKRPYTNRTRTTLILLALVPFALLALGCRSLTQLVQKARDIKMIKPSGVIITEAREAKDFTALDIRTLGNVTLTQGDRESLTVRGSDNVVALIITRVSGGVLIIETEEPIGFRTTSSEDALTFEVVVKDLNKLTVSGVANVEMDALETSALEVSMSGAGRVRLDDLRADRLAITVSGLGDVEIGGQVARQEIAISGAGGVENADLKSGTASVTVSGLGTATLWVTDNLTGKISGSGNVRYYGSPKLETETPGLGRFQALGNK